MTFRPASRGDHRRRRAPLRVTTGAGIGLDHNRTSVPDSNDPRNLRSDLIHSKVATGSPRDVAAPRFRRRPPRISRRPSRPGRPGQPYPLRPHLLPLAGDQVAALRALAPRERTLLAAGPVGLRRHHRMGAAGGASTSTRPATTPGYRPAQTRATVPPKARPTGPSGPARVQAEGPSPARSSRSLLRGSARRRVRLTPPAAARRGPAGPTRPPRGRPAP